MTNEAFCANGQVNDKNTLLQIFKNFSYNTEIGEFKKSGVNMFNNSMERSQKSSMN